MSKKTSQSRPRQESDNIANIQKGIPLSAGTLVTVVEGKGGRIEDVRSLDGSKIVTQQSAVPSKSPTRKVKELSRHPKHGPQKRQGEVELSVGLRNTNAEQVRQNWRGLDPKVRKHWFEIANASDEQNHLALASFGPKLRLRLLELLIRETTQGTSHDAAWLQEKADEAKYLEMKARVFGEATVTIKAFQAYLNSLCASKNNTTYKEKQAIAETIKYWKGRERFVLFYNDKECGLTAKSNGGKGRYRVHVRGEDPISLATFPALTCRRNPPA